VVWHNSSLCCWLLCKKGPAQSRNDRPPATILNALEVKTNDLFVQFSCMLVQPKSLTHIHGLPFIAAHPL